LVRHVDSLVHRRRFRVSPSVALHGGGGIVTVWAEEPLLAVQLGEAFLQFGHTFL
jgi:hypothetical protein